ncbi:universal stress protein [Mycetocola miduiensis]|uniref:Nucleotide-binding universal stress protein, UspA family n=1 Tax=Mycetocola miduiensis TaxID=995034 RepID=A0A1I5CVI9_9MICO|nr:universal stress protein [Mycetocola miduiensis]SFN90974.1 Nucleotide-binding universal stress protein, UspA family [Mycetocola miduiensis]
MIEKVVVGWDGSDGAERAIEWALTRPSSEKIVLVQVDNDIALEETFAADSTAAVARINLMEKAERIRDGHPDRTIHTELVQGDTVASLAAFSSPSALIAVGTRHATGSRPRRSWSVGARLAATAHGPVAIIPHPFVTDGHTIVVGVDDPEEAALLFAAEEASRTGATLRPVRAWQGPPLWPGQTEHDPELLESLAEMYRDIVTDAMESILVRYPDLMTDPIIEQGSPSDVLLEAARGAGMLVVGNRGFRGIKRFFLGSVSHTVVLSAAVPTVVVNAPTR